MDRPLGKFKSRPLNMSSFVNHFPNRSISSPSPRQSGERAGVRGSATKPKASFIASAKRNLKVHSAYCRLTVQGLKARNMIARGEAPGTASNVSKALKGRHKAPEAFYSIAIAKIDFRTKSISARCKEYKILRNSESVTQFLPLPKGEGRGEGERSVQRPHAYDSFINSNRTTQ